MPRTAKQLRDVLRHLDIADSIAAFAETLTKPDGGTYRRQSIYGALKNPSRFPLLHRRIRKALV